MVFSTIRASKYSSNLKALSLWLTLNAGRNRVNNWVVRDVLRDELVKGRAYTSTGGAIHKGSQISVCSIERAVDNPQWELLNSVGKNCFYLLDIGIAVELRTKFIDGWEGY